MGRDVQEPAQHQERDGRTVLEHPGFGQIRVSRVSGSRTLYGSDFVHHGYVTVEISRSELHRDLSKDWHFGRNEIVTVDMSEAQWAAFVSSFGVGGGVPCTIDSIEGKMMPSFPLRDEGQEFKLEVDGKLAKSVQAIDAALAAIDALGLSKAKAAAARDPLLKAKQDLESNLPYVARQFGEHMETRVEKAKVEVNAYMTETLVRAGLQALGAKAPLLLESE